MIEKFCSFVLVLVVFWINLLRFNMGDFCIGLERGMFCFNFCFLGIEEVILIK